MRKTNALLILAVLICGYASAQVVSVSDIKDPQLRALQHKYIEELQQLGADIVSLPLEYPFYLSRKLDIDEVQQKAGDQRSIRFDHYQGKTTLELTGNYYAAYSAEKMSAEQRSKATFDAIILPILKLEVSRFQDNPSIQAYAFEISHHILGKVMGVAMERPENLMMVIPQSEAIRLVGSADESSQQAALLQSEIYLNGKPVTLWVNGEGPQLAAQKHSSDRSDLPAAALQAKHGDDDSSDRVAGGGDSNEAVPTRLALNTIKAPALIPIHDTSPQALASLQAAHKQTLDTMLKELDPQAHFVAYAAPTFIAFRKQVYLDLSINSDLPESSGGSRYRLAALTFDDHISHLLRPILGYFKDESQFDGISLSANIHLASKTNANTAPLAVEFFFPFKALRCYESYDCTGQQLIDAGTVLINGERVGLDLQVAENQGH
jgi:hypothetical protein